MQAYAISSQNIHERCYMRKSKLEISPLKSWKYSPGRNCFPVCKTLSILFSDDVLCRNLITIFNYAIALLETSLMSESKNKIFSLLLEKTLVANAQIYSFDISMVSAIFSKTVSF